MSTFDTCFAVVVGVEGGYTNDPADDGNWTGGKRGVGTLKGSKFGISAASYPTLDIADLSLADAKVIYARDYWAKVHGDSLPPPLALVSFDGIVSQGPGAAPKDLQAALGVTVDGIIGPKTLGAAKALPLTTSIPALSYVRELRYRQAANFPIYGHGWLLRLASIVFQAGQIAGNS